MFCLVDGFGKHLLTNDSVLVRADSRSFREAGVEGLK
jgi:hypothetical protein